ncbi:hypothetical protein GQ44DRAFT_700625, partial [Phaeosphaeriaceae sp. PMI808]
MSNGPRDEALTVLQSSFLRATATLESRIEALERELEESHLAHEQKERGLQAQLNDRTQKGYALQNRLMGLERRLNERNCQQEMVTLLQARIKTMQEEKRAAQALLNAAKKRNKALEGKLDIARKLRSAPS